MSQDGYKQVIREQVVQKTNGHCWYCGCIPEEYKGCIEHQTPTSRGGTYTLDNLVFACANCNSKKSTKTLEEYRFVLQFKYSDSGDLYSYYFALKRCFALCPSDSHQDHLEQLIRSAEAYCNSNPIVFWGEKLNRYCGMEAG